MTAPDVVDVAVVGSGIAGAALAVRLAREGLAVHVVEREEQYRDRVRGEAMMPWGVVEARRLGIEQTLLDAGAGFAERSMGYDETTAPADAFETPLSIFLDGVPGILDVGHPQACEALRTLARTSGARVVDGVSGVEVTVGSRPSLRYEHDGGTHEVQARMIVGADGRQSTVRKQLGIALHETDPVVILSGLLVSDLDEWPVDVTVLGTEGDVHYLVFPRPGGIARLYIGHLMSTRDRFTGPDRMRTFLDSFRLESLPLGDAVADATPAGPCAGHPCTDSWTDRPVVEGAVLIGDAAGYSDQLIGQGLSIALRDARSVADVLVGDDWSMDAFDAYCEERAERMRRIRVMSSVMTAIRCDFTPEGQARRAAYFSQMMGDPLLLGIMLGILAGHESAAPEAFDDGALDRVMALA